MSVLVMRRRNAAKKYTWKKYAVTQAYTTKHYFKSGTIYISANDNTAYSAYFPSASGAKFLFSQYLPDGEYAINPANYYLDYPYFAPMTGTSLTVDKAYYCSGKQSGQTLYYSMYYTRELTDQKGSYIEDVKSTDENAYPANGVHGGYWYVKQ